MGWGGYGIYDGDDTQTRFYDFAKWAKLGIDDEYIAEEVLLINGVTLTKELQDKFLENINLVLKKMPKKWNKGYSYDIEQNAIEWQMLLAVFVDNKMKVPHIILENGIEATEFLMLDHAEDFDYPGSRKRVLRNFIKKAKKLKKFRKVVA